MAARAPTDRNHPVSFQSRKTCQSNATPTRKYRHCNETSNTLKNQEHNLDRNFDLGKKYLSTNFVMLMMPAFLADQTRL
jgi:hypothetical protein